MIDFFRELREAVPPERDPYLAHLDAAGREWVQAGFHFHAAAVHRRLGRPDDAARHMREFEARIPPPFRIPQQPEPADRFSDWDGAGSR